MLIRLLVPVSLFDSPVSVLNAVGRTDGAAGHESVPQAAATMPASSPAIVNADTGSVSNTQPLVPSASSGDTRVTARSFDWTTAARYVWYAGVAAVGLSLLLSNLRFAFQLRRSRKAYATHGGLPVYVAENLPSPCLFGPLRPAIYITARRCPVT